MTRKRATVLYIIFVLVMGFFFMKFGNRYFTPEQVLHANEYGLHYGPSEEVLLKYKGKDNNMLVVGKIDDKSLSVIPAKRSLFVLWKLESGGIPGYVTTHYEEDRVCINYSANHEVAYGITDMQEAKRVSFYIEHKNNSMPEFEIRGPFEAEIDEEGFFHYPVERVDEESWYYIRRTVLLDENGYKIYEQDY